MPTRAPERRHLQRLRWRGTVLFAITTTMCLVVLAVMASVIDARSHERETFRELGTIATQLSRSAETSTNGLHFTPESVQGWKSVQGTFAYVDDKGILVASPSQGSLPSSLTISALVSQARRTKASVTTDAPTFDDDRPFHWLAQGVPYSDTVVLAGASAAPTPAHRSLNVFLALTVIALAIIGSGLGHLLSGLAMRPAIRGIEQHEQFLREAAHELRTPLAVLQLAVDSASETEESGSIASHVKRMSDLVARLLDRARIRGADPATFTMEPIRLDQVVELAVEDVAGADKVQVHLQPVIVEGHSELLSQAVRNLVENALRHGVEPITVDVRDHRLIVEDSGDGVPAAQRRALLLGGQPTGLGTGTGLAIVSWVAGLHRARVSLADAVPHGLRVTVTFPQ